MNPTAHSLELLEPRIAPASTLALVDAQTATYTDVDGDHVTVHFSKPILTSANLDTILETVPSGMGDELKLMDVAGAPNASGTDITVTAKAGPSGGDGLSNVDDIFAMGVDLGTIKIQGDLADILVGSATATNIAVHKLQTQTIGLYADLFHGNVNLDILGQLGALKVAGDVDIAGIEVSDPASAANAKIGSIFIGGSLNKGSISADGSIGSIHVGQINGGAISAAGDIGAATVVGAVVPGSEPAIQSVNGGIASLNLSGRTATASLFEAKTDIGSVNAAGELGGQILSDTGKIGPVHIQGGLTGSIQSEQNLGPINVSGDFSGTISASDGTIAMLKIGGSFLGGRVTADTIGSIKIAHDVANVRATGNLIAARDLGPVTVGGSVTGDGSANAFLSATGSLGPVKIGGDFDDALIDVPMPSATMSSIKIGGSLTGGGKIESAGDTGPIAIGGGLSGSILSDSGAIGAIRIGGSMSGQSVIEAKTTISSVAIGKDLTDQSSIMTSTGEIGPVSIGDSFAGGASIAAQTDLVSLTVGRDVTGIGSVGTSVLSVTGDIDAISVGGSLSAAFIQANRDLKALTVKGNVDGSALIAENGAIDTLTIHGSMRDTSGIHAQTNLGAATIGGDFTRSTIVVVGGGITSLKIAGSIVGAPFASITVSGDIESVTVGGGMSDGDITSELGKIGALKIAGSVFSSTIDSLTNIDSVAIGGTFDHSTIIAQGGSGLHQVVGNITIGGNFVASNIVAGAEDKNGDGFGSADDQFVSASSTITKITIGGTVAGDGLLFGSFGIEAQEITGLFLHGKPVALTAGPDNDVINLLPLGALQVSEVTTVTLREL
jgi:hypothetical protein